MLKAAAIFLLVLAVAVAITWAFGKLFPSKATEEEREDLAIW